MFPIPVTIITGFLGAGKTTLINRILDDPALRDTAVIVNEFGEVAIDHLLVEQSSDDVIEIAGGCLCCTVRGELAETLTALVDRLESGELKNLERILVETTGMADPIPVLHAVEGNPVLAQKLHIDRVITVVDAISGASSLASFEEAQRQLAVADIVLISKQTLADDKDTQRLREEIERRTSARIVGEHEVAGGVLDLLEIDTHDRRPMQSDDHGHHHHDHTSSVTTHVIRHDDALPWHLIEAFVDLIRSRSEFGLLRLKGIVETLETPGQPLVLHGVQNRLYPPRQLERWPDRAPHGTTLVLIGTAIDGQEIDRLFKAFLNMPQLDAPDRQAIVDNPLAIPGSANPI